MKHVFIVAFTQELSTTRLRLHADRVRLASVPSVGDMVRVSLDQEGKPHHTDMTIKKIIWFDEPDLAAPIGQLLLA